jgi:hypothetical protein
MLMFVCLLFVLWAGPHSLIDFPRDLGEAHWDQQVSRRWTYCGVDALCPAPSKDGESLSITNVPCSMGGGSCSNVVTILK